MESVFEDSAYTYNPQTCWSFSCRHLEDLQCDDSICAGVCLPAMAYTSLTTQQLDNCKGWICPMPGFAYHLSRSPIRQGPRQKWWVFSGEKLCQKFFYDVMTQGHKLHHLLPESRSVLYSTTRLTKYPTTSRIRRRLSLYSAKALASALVASRLDYCNSVFHGVARCDQESSWCDLDRLQRVQNSLACVVTRFRPFSHALSLLQSLHCFQSNLEYISNLRY